MAGKNLPTARTVLKTAAMAVTGEKLVDSSEKTSEYALMRTIRSDNSVSYNLRRASAFGGTNVTSPSFYSPMTTASSWQIPNNRKEVYMWADWWYNNEPKIAAGINFYAHFPFNGYELECSNTYVKDYFEKLVQKLNFSKWLPLISQEYHLRGDVFVFASIDCEHCQGQGETKNGDKCDHAGATWRSLSILNPDMVDVSLTIMDQEPTYTYKPTDEMLKVVMERKPKHVFDALSPKLMKMIQARQDIPLAPESIWHFKRGAAPWGPFGISILRALFPTLAYKDKLRQAQWLVAERHIVPIKVVKVGDKERPASQDDIQAVQDELTNLANDPLLTIVTHHAFEFDFVGASGKVLQLTNEYELIDQEIIDGLMLNKAIINGDGPSYANAQVGLLTMAQRLEALRSQVAHWIEERLFKPVAIWNDFKIEGERGQDEYVYPTIKFDNLQLRDETGKLQMLVTAQQNGVISAQTLIEAFDFDYDQEVERLRYEQSANFINSSDIASGGGGGYGAPIAGGAPAGGMPPMGGAPGGMPPMGGGAPNPDGAAPMGAPDMGGMPPMAAAVRDHDKAYRFARQMSNDIYDRARSSHDEFVAVRTAALKKTRRVIGQNTLHFLDSIKPVSGRGFGNQLPEELTDVFPLDQIGPVNGGLICSPLNYYAFAEDERRGFVRTAAGKKDEKPQPRLFTKLEQKLYNIILANNIPFAFYAQYQAGPSSQYQIDGAFPAIKLGVEADSKTFHSSPDKIAQDKRRDMELATQGWTILRFTEQEINEKTEEVLNVILSTIHKLAKHQQGGGLVF